MFSRRTISASSAGASVWRGQRRQRPRQPRRGIVLVYALVLLLVFSAFVSLGVDWGHVQLCKTELAVAADAAARAAVAQLPDVSAAQAAAIAYAGYNNADGSSVVLAAGDIELGSWNPASRTFTVLTGAAQSGANAVRVTAKRTAAGGNAVNLTFGRVLGQNTCDARAVSIAAIGGSAYPIAGLSGITAGDQLFVASYDSSVTTTPDHTNYSSSGSLASNGVIDVHNADQVYGNVTLGPGGSDPGLLVSGSTTTLPADLPTPATPAMTPVTNPGGVSPTQNLPNGATVIWPGGTYYFTSFTAGNGVTITFTGPATVYMNADATFNDRDTITPSDSRPANLVWYQAAGTTFSSYDRCSFTGEFFGPSAAFTTHDRAYVAGSLFFQSLTFHSQCDVYYDQSICGLPSTSGISLVK